MSIFNKIFLPISHIGFFWQERFNGQIFRWNMFFLFLQSLLLFLKYNDLPSQIPIFYSLPWGESQLGNSSLIFILPSLSVLILFINNILAVYYLKSVPLISRLLVVFSLVSTVFCTITVYKIITLIS